MFMFQLSCLGAKPSSFTKTLNLHMMALNLNMDPVHQLGPLQCIVFEIIQDPCIVWGVLYHTTFMEEQNEGWSYSKTDFRKDFKCSPSYFNLVSVFLGFRILRLLDAIRIKILLKNCSKNFVNNQSRDLMDLLHAIVRAVLYNAQLL